MIGELKPEWSECLADDGDQCDHCGEALAEGQSFWTDVRLRVRWRFCSIEHGLLGVTEKSRKARFIGAVLGPHR